MQWWAGRLAVSSRKHGEVKEGEGPDSGSTMCRVGTPRAPDGDGLGRAEQKRVWQGSPGCCVKTRVRGHRRRWGPVGSCCCDPTWSCRAVAGVLNILCGHCGFPRRTPSFTACAEVKGASKSRCSRRCAHALRAGLPQARALTTEEAGVWGSFIKRHDEEGAPGHRRHG